MFQNFIASWVEINSEKQFTFFRNYFHRCRVDLRVIIIFFIRGYQSRLQTRKLYQDKKSVNLQYNMLVNWANRTNDSLIVWCSNYYYYFFFWIKNSQFFAKTLSIYSFYKITKLKIMSFECHKSIRNYEKNTLNVRRLVAESFVQSAQLTSLLHIL